MAFLQCMDATSDSLLVLFPEASGGSVPLSAAMEELSEFGEIAGVEVAPGPRVGVTVSYYDVRSAAAATKALGARAEPVPSRGNRTVCLSGDVSLDTWMVSEVQAVRQGDDGETFHVEFFDRRAACRAAKSLTAPQTVEPARIGTNTSRSAEAPATATSAPRSVCDLRASRVDWKELSSGREMRTTLCLRCVPAALCSEAALRRALASAGLSEAARSICAPAVARGARTGIVYVDAVDAAGVRAVTKFFHGRRWGRSLPVEVSFAAVQESAVREEARKAASVLVAGREADVGKASLVLPPGLEEMLTSEGSTSASELGDQGCAHDVDGWSLGGASRQLSEVVAA